ncbi:MAG: glycosyltransferase family 4 protein [Chitinophagaceae bacterium]
MNKQTVSRILYLGISPIQNSKPFRILEQRTDVSITVAYLKKPLADIEKDKESITKDAFDTDMLSGYNHHFLKTFNITKRGFFSFISTEIIRLIKEHDIIVVFGHNYFTFWIAMLSAKFYRKKLMQTTDATYMEATAESKGWKMKFKPMFLRWLYNRYANGVFVTSTASRIFLESVGIKKDRIAVIPYAVDEDMIQSVSAKTDVGLIRSQLKIPTTNTVFVFCAKFIDRKRPMDAIEAFARLHNSEASLIMIGEGPLMSELRRRVNELGLSDNVLFPGLVKYSTLPSYYTASNVLVFCSDHEPYGLPVNEAMLCGKPVILSDRIGARLDLVEEGKTGWIYPTGDIKELANCMQTALNNTVWLKEMGKLAEKKMLDWSSQTYVEKQLGYMSSQNWLNHIDQ